MTELLGLLNTMTPVDGQRRTTAMEPLIPGRERTLLATGTDVNAIPLPDPTQEASTWSRLDPDDEDDVELDLTAMTVGARATVLLLAATLVLTVVAGALAVSIV